MVNAKDTQKNWEWALSQIQPAMKKDEVDGLYLRWAMVRVHELERLLAHCVKDLARIDRGEKTAEQVLDEMADYCWEKYDK